MSATFQVSCILKRWRRTITESRLNLLRTQLDLHFLFNTISSHVECDPKLTRRLIEHLGDLLRTSLETKDKPEVSLSEELWSLEHYLAIQQIRFGSPAQVQGGDHTGGAVRKSTITLHATPSRKRDPPGYFAPRRWWHSNGESRWCRWPALNSRARRWSGPAHWLVFGISLSIIRERIVGRHPNGDRRFTVRNRTESGTVLEISLPLHVKGAETNCGVEVGLDSSRRNGVAPDALAGSLSSESTLG